MIGLWRDPSNGLLKSLYIYIYKWVVCQPLYSKQPGLCWLLVYIPIITDETFTHITRPGAASADNADVVASDHAPGKITRSWQSHQVITSKRGSYLPYLKLTAPNAPENKVFPNFGKADRLPVPSFFRGKLTVKLSKLVVEKIHQQQIGWGKIGPHVWWPKF